MIDATSTTGGTPRVEQNEQEEPIEDTVNDSGKPKRHRSASTAELYTVLEALLPFAQTEIEWLDEYVRTMPDDPDHAEDTVRAQVGLEAIESAGRLIARKSATIRRKQKALTREHGTVND